MGRTGRAALTGATDKRNPFKAARDARRAHVKGREGRRYTPLRSFLGGMAAGGLALGWVPTRGGFRLLRRGGKAIWARTLGRGKNKTQQDGAGPAKGKTPAATVEESAAAGQRTETTTMPVPAPKPGPPVAAPHPTAGGTIMSDLQSDPATQMSNDPILRGLYELGQEMVKAANKYDPQDMLNVGRGINTLPAIAAQFTEVVKILSQKHERVPMHQAVRDTIAEAIKVQGDVEQTYTVAAPAFFRIHRDQILALLHPVENAHMWDHTVHRNNGSV